MPSIMLSMAACVRGEYSLSDGSQPLGPVDGAGGSLRNTGDKR